MQLGILSDTHSILPQKVFQHFNNVDYIFHAGDIGDKKIIEDLKNIAPVIAVFGNVDSGIIKRELPAIYYNKLDGYEICLVHDIGSVKNFSYELFKQSKKPDLVIYGHTHKPNSETFQNIHFVNPGSASFPRGQKSGSIAIVSFNGDLFSHHLIEL